jgi:hypothetical protein
MDKETILVGGSAALASLAYRVYSEGRLKDFQKYKNAETGRFMYSMFFIDLMVQLGLAFIGFILAYFIFQTPVMSEYKDYFPITAMVMAIMSEHLLPIGIELIVFKANQFSERTKVN